MPTPPLCCLRFLLFKIRAVSRRCRAWCLEHSKMLLGILAVNLDLPLCVFLLSTLAVGQDPFVCGQGFGSVDVEGWSALAHATIVTRKSMPARLDNEGAAIDNGE